jgi:hypothetical protein
MDKIPGRTIRKLVVAVVGMLAIVLGPDVLGLAPGEELFGVGQDTVVGLVLTLLTALGVYAAPNDPA